MDKVSIEYSFKATDEFDPTEKKTWSNRYSSFIDWQKCDSAFLDGRWDYGTYYCNDKILFENEYNYLAGMWRFVWTDLNDNKWITTDTNSFYWKSAKCTNKDNIDGYYSDRTTHLYYQYNSVLDQNWAVLVKIKRFYKRVTPKF